MDDEQAGSYPAFALRTRINGQKKIALDPALGNLIPFAGAITLTNTTSRQLQFSVKASR
jgi:hypothetical protein